jgi:two-component system cell cycle sensor histidine kinase/response regulator CckA
MDAPIEVLLQHWPGVLFRQMPDLRFTFLGSRIEKWTGVPVETLSNEPGAILECVHDADAERVRQQLSRVVQGPDESTLRFRLRHATTGRVTHVSEFRRAVRGKKGELNFHEGYWQDETRLAHAELRLESASWTETLSRLTPGFAHDFNNVIAGVHGLSATFLNQLEPGHPFLEGLALMKHNTQQAAQFVQRLQQLHLPRTGERAYHDLNAVVKDTSELLARGLGKHVEIVTELAPDPLPIHASLAGLQQVILALAFNAADAMTERGRLVFRLSAHAKATGAANFVGTLPAGPCVCLAVQDTGHGIKSRHLAGVFAAEFTTKPGRHGLGIGLHHARLFAESHGGALTVESTEGVGSTFQLWLPRANFTEAEAAGALKPGRGVLLAGQPPRTWGDTADALRASGIRVGIADGNAEELLAAPDLEFDAVLLRLAPNDPEPARLIQFIRRNRLPVKLVVQPAGCGEEDLEPKLLEKADLVLAESVSPERAAERIARELLGGA